MNERRFDQHGFTLIELMIVIAILGVLVAIAVPSLNRYVARTQVTRVHGEISHYRNPVEALLMAGEQEELAADAKTAVNFVDSELSSVTFGSFADAGTSTITATLDGRSSSFVQGTTVTLSRDVLGGWTCTVLGAGGGWSERMKPNACR